MIKDPAVTAEASGGNVNSMPSEPAPLLANPTPYEDKSGTSAVA